MNEIRCLFVGVDRPRMLRDRHLDECDGDCRGCLPCGMDHCRRCNVVHAEGACPGCLLEVSQDLAEIADLYRRADVEAQHRGVDSEAMNLAGPVANREARAFWEASVLAGRIVPADCDARDLDDVRAWLSTASSELHPLIVIGDWTVIYRAELEHEQPLGATDVIEDAAYLTRHIEEIANNLYVDFNQFASQVARSRGYVESVLHSGTQVERTRVTCTNEYCRKRPRLERHYGYGEANDRWICPACETVYDDHAYRDAHARQLRHEGAVKYLSKRDAVATLIAQGRPERTIRKWFEECEVKAYCELGTHRVMVWWPDMWRLHLTTPTRQRAAA